MNKLIIAPFVVGAFVLIGCDSPSAEIAASKACGGPFVREIKVVKESTFKHEEEQVICNDGTKHIVKFE